MTYFDFSLVIAILCTVAGVALHRAAKWCWVQLRKSR